MQDPTSLRDWYKQNLRWLWGTFQGILGHRVGRQVNTFDYAYLLLILRWVLSAWRLHHRQLLLLLPLIMVADVTYRVIFVHAAVKAVRQPTVDRCVWSSPERIGTPVAVGGAPTAVAGWGAKLRRRNSR